MRFRLAQSLGMTVAELEQRLTFSEFLEWCAFYSIEPWGSEQDDLRAGLERKGTPRKMDDASIEAACMAHARLVNSRQRTA
jgi:hypothetical protein